VPRLQTNKNDLLIILAFIVTYNLVMDVFCLMRYWSFNAGAFDLGIMVQTMWNTVNGNILWESVNMGKPASRFWNGRWELILLPVAALYRFCAKPEFLLILQTFVVSLGIIPVYLLSRKILGGVLPASAVALCYIVNPVIHNPNIFDFHSVTLSIPMIIGLVYLTEEKNNSHWIVLLFFLILFCRADLAPLLSAYSVYLFVAHKRRKLSIAFLVISLLWVIASRSTDQIREMLHLPGIVNTNVYTGRWEHIGGTNPLDVVGGVFKNPIPLLATLFNLENAKYLVKILAPFAFLPILRPAILFLALPSILINAASNWTPAHHIYHHYNAHVGAVMIIATIYAVGYLIKIVPAVRGYREDRVKAGTIFLLLAASIGSLAFKSNGLDIVKWKINEHTVKLASLLDQVEREQSVSSHFLLLDHIANREEIYLFPDNVGKVEVVVYDIRLPFDRIMSHDMIAHRKVGPLNDQLRILLNNRAYGIRSYDDGAMLFEKGSDHAEGIRRLMEVKGFDGFESRDLVLDNGMVIEALRRNGVVGNDFSQLSYSLICRIENGDQLEPINFLLREGENSEIGPCSTLLSTLEGLGSMRDLEDQFVDEICVDLPEGFDRSGSISVYVLGSDLRYHPFDTVEGSGAPYE